MSAIELGTATAKLLDEGRAERLEWRGVETREQQLRRPVRLESRVAQRAGMRCERVVAIEQIGRGMFRDMIGEEE